MEHDILATIFISIFMFAAFIVYAVWKEYTE